MKYYAYLICSLFILVSFAGAEVNKKSETEIIESTILWESKLDKETWEPIELQKLISKNSYYKKEGNFYKIENKKVMAFGHEVIYLGLLGIELIPGPNAVLKGTPKEIADYIEKKRGLKFVSNKGEYMCDLKKHIKLVIGKHPSMKNASLIIGAYLGP